MNQNYDNINAQGMTEAISKAVSSNLRARAAQEGKNLEYKILKESIEIVDYISKRVNSWVEDEPEIKS